MVSRPGRKASVLHLSMLGLGVLSLGGCASGSRPGLQVGPDYRAPSAQEEISSLSTPTPEPRADLAAQPASEFMRAFGDAALLDVIDLATRRSPPLEQAAARIRQARAAAGASQANAAPTVAASGSLARAGRLEQSGQGSAAAAINAGWDLDVFGTALRAIEAADARRQSAELSGQQARLSLTTEVASAYLTLRQCQAAAGLLEQEVKSRETTATLTGVKAQAGAVALQEWDRSEAAVLDARLRLASQQEVCNQGVHRLALLAGVTPQGLPPSVLAARPLPQASVRPGEPVSVPAEVLARRPDVQAAERLLAAASADIGATQAQYLPSLSLAGNIGLNLTGLGNDSISARTWSFGPSLRLPVFDAGRRTAAIESAGGRYDEALATWRQSVLQAAKEVEDALSRTATARASARVAQQAAERYAAHERAVRARLSAGAASLLELEDARRLAIAARNAQLTAELELHQSRLALHKATGGDLSTSSEKASAEMPKEAR